jgi:hypothetical protein
MDKEEKLLRVSYALNELYRNGCAFVLIGDIFHTVTDTLSLMDIEYTFKVVNDTHNVIELIKN